MRRKIMLAVMAIGMASVIACVAPKTKQVIINSEPQGATILIDGEAVGQTPMKRDIKFKDTKKERHLIQIRKEGFRSTERYFLYRDDENILFQLDRLN